MQDTINNCKSWSEFYRKITGKGQPNGRTLTKFIKDHSFLNTDHFDKWAASRKYVNVEKQCPVCHELFTVKLGSPSEKVTCSHSCANTYYRSGDNNGNWKVDAYRTTCFLHHEKKCVVCSESNIVEVHHFDEDHNNNNVTNLVPLCPTHHQYWHSSFKHLVYNVILDYVENFKTEFETLLRDQIISTNAPPLEKYGVKYGSENAVLICCR